MLEMIGECLDAKQVASFAPTVLWHKKCASSVIKKYAYTDHIIFCNIFDILCHYVVQNTDKTWASRHALCPAPGQYEKAA